MGRTAALRRVVAPETLDTLAESDPAAMRSRRDLRRIHRFMGTRSIVHRALQGLGTMRPGAAPLRMLELGAGDGRLMLGVAQALALAGPRVELTLLDRQALVEPETIQGYARCGWVATPAVADVHHWAAESRATPRLDLIVANLFLHHFEGAALAALLAAIASKGSAFFACEPRRAWAALAGSHLVGAIGANAVTREDAVLSVHAGFRDAEITALWPGAGTGMGTGWATREYSAGLFSHCFVAQRVRMREQAP